MEKLCKEDLIKYKLLKSYLGNIVEVIRARNTQIVTKTKVGETYTLKDGTTWLLLNAKETKANGGKKWKLVSGTPKEKKKEEQKENTPTTIKSAGYNNEWSKPSNENIEQEYKVEYGKHIKDSYGDIFPTIDDFKEAIEHGEVRTLTDDFNSKISGRSNTGTKASLLNLIKGYKSYPKYRNEQTLDDLYMRISNNLPVDAPIVLKTQDGYKILSGNTRLDIAMQLGKTPKVVVIDPKWKSKQKEESDQKKEKQQTKKLRVVSDMGINSSPTIEKRRRRIERSGLIEHFNFNEEMLKSGGYEYKIDTIIGETDDLISDDLRGRMIDIDLSENNYKENYSSTKRDDAQKYIASLDKAHKLTPERAVREYSGLAYVSVNGALNDNTMLRGEALIISKMDKCFEKNAKVIKNIKVERGLKTEMSVVKKFTEKFIPVDVRVKMARLRKEIDDTDKREKLNSEINEYLNKTLLDIEYVDNGFISTSMNGYTADGWAGEGQHTHKDGLTSLSENVQSYEMEMFPSMKLTIKGDFKGIDLNDKELTGHESENELLLQRGKHILTITGANYNMYKKRIDLELSSELKGE